MSLRDTLNTIMDDLNELGVIVAQLPMRGLNAVASADGLIALDDRRLETTAQLCTVLAHEAGHFLVGAFYNPYARFEVRRKAELRAERAAVCRYIPYEDLIAQMRSGRDTAYELAEYYGVTEEFVIAAYYYYRDECGLSFAAD